MHDAATIRSAVWARAAGPACGTADEALRDVRAVVLVEGESDRAALETLASRQGLDLELRGVVVVPVGGATNIGRYLRVLAPLDVAVAGLCDIAEARFVRRGLVAAGLAASGADADLSRAGFFVCDADLEDELLRSLGVAGAEEVLRLHGDLTAFRRFQRQPAQRDRPATHQLHRFLGTTSGRKALYARRLSARLDLSRTPAPLAELLERVA